MVNQSWKKHCTGYYSKIQQAMELSGFRTCDFVIYTFKDYLRNKSIFYHKVVLDV